MVQVTVLRKGGTKEDLKILKPKFCKNLSKNTIVLFPSLIRRHPFLLSPPDLHRFCFKCTPGKRTFSSHLTRSSTQSKSQNKICDLFVLVDTLVHTLVFIPQVLLSSGFTHLWKASPGVFCFYLNTKRNLAFLLPWLSTSNPD